MIEMTNDVLQVGTGVFVIAIVWIAALVVAIILLRAAGSAKWVEEAASHTALTRCWYKACTTGMEMPDGSKRDL